MTATTEYGTWTDRINNHSHSVREDVIAALGDHVGDFDVEALIDAYRAAINSALPDDVSLHGDLFFGPYYADNQHFDGYPLTADGRLDIKAIVDGIDFWALAVQHDISRQGGRGE